MVFRLSQKLAKKLKVPLASVAPPDPVAFADWSAHLFTADRKQYVLLTNTPSLYSAVLPGRGITSDREFVEAALACLREFMLDDGLGFFYERFVAPAAASVTFSKALNRSVTGSMNDLVYHSQGWIIEYGLTPWETSLKLNEIPMAPLGYRNPREAFKSLAVADPASPGGDA